MTEALEDRLSQIEEVLGMGTYDLNNPILDILALTKKLQTLKNKDGRKTDFIMKIPKEKLQRLFISDRKPDMIPTKEKIISIDFTHELMLKRVELLEDLKRLSEIVFKSKDFAKITEFESTLDKAEKELSEALTEAIKYDEEICEFYNEYLPMLNDLTSRVEDLEHIRNRLK